MAAPRQSANRPATASNQNSDSVAPTTSPSPMHSPTTRTAARLRREPRTPTAAAGTDPNANASPSEGLDRVTRAAGTEHNAPSSAHDHRQTRAGGRADAIALAARRPLSW